MIKRCLTFFLYLFVVHLCLFTFTADSQAQNTSDEIEVYLDFRHRGIISSVVTTYYRNDEFYLPVTGLFDLFRIDTNAEGLIINGKFGLEQTPYTINFQANYIQFGDERTEINSDQYIVKELDYFLNINVFAEVFGLNFSVDFNNLALNLETNKELPIVEQAIRQRRRRIADNNSYTTEMYELKYDRNSTFLDGGFFDYNLLASMSPSTDGYGFNYTSNVGVQLAGGDLQGSLFGNVSQDINSFATRNLRWRYITDDYPGLFTKVMIGQTGTDGIANTYYTGIRLTNEPIEPRRLFDEFEIIGNTIPQSEVEVYLNNSLIDFDTANELGDYRFLVPVPYGSTQLGVQIYGPTGQVTSRLNQIQVPFAFQPQGEFIYYLNAGRLDNPIIGTTDKTYTAQFNGSYGIANWLTARAGVEYYEGVHDNLPTFTTTLSSRFLKNYVLTLEAATQAYVRSYLNVIYPNSASLNVDYTEFTNNIEFYNPSNEDRRFILSGFYPFRLFSVPFNVRGSSISRIRTGITSTNLRFDIGSRIGLFTMRVGYSDRYIGRITLLDPNSSASIESSVTYNISRSRSIPKALQGAFLRAQMNYQPNKDRMESVEALISQNVANRGRFQLSLGRNLISDFNTLRFSLVLDLDRVRTNTTYTNFRGNSTISQNIRGSVGYDTNYNNFIFTSRDQVGRSGAAVRMYVDNNANNTFDEGDQSIPEGTVRMGRSGTTTVRKDGVLYYTIMEPYFRYNIEMNKASIKNPMLVPDLEKFSIVTDPNTFKNIEIPFYRAGVMDGRVLRMFASGQTEGIGGLKLKLTSADGEYLKDLRTFSDGSFYEYPLPPGNYEVAVDESQLELLNSVSQPEKIEFEVQATAEGDFIEGIEFTLIPENMVRDDTLSTEEVLGLSDVSDEIKNSREVRRLEQTLRKKVDDALKLLVRAQMQFYEGDTNQALSLVDQSLAIFETAQGYALKGSLYYLKGNSELAQRNWDMAVRFDPDIYIPDIEYLDQIINTNSSG